MGETSSSSSSLMGFSGSGRLVMLPLLLPLPGEVVEGYGVCSSRVPMMTEER